MVVWFLIAIPAILVFGGIGLAMSSKRNIIMGKLLFEFKEYERGVVFRFGKYHRTVGPGWVFLIPVIENYVRYDLRTEAVDIPPQEVITKDAVKLVIDAVLYMRVEDPVKAELYVEADYRSAVEEYAKGRIRNVIGSVEMTRLFSNIDSINDRLREEVQSVAEQWGIIVSEIELVDVSPPPEVVQALQAQEIAERYKAAAVEEAKTMQIRIEAVQKAAGKMNDQALTYMYINALKDIADGRSTKLIFPLEFSNLAKNLAGGSQSDSGASNLEKIAERVLSRSST